MLHVVPQVGWGFFGDTWPYFRPNWLNLEAYRATHGATEVGLTRVGPGAGVVTASFPDNNPPQQAPVHHSESFPCCSLKPVRQGTCSMLRPQGSIKVPTVQCTAKCGLALVISPLSLTYTNTSDWSKTCSPKTRACCFAGCGVLPYRLDVRDEEHGIPSAQQGGLLNPPGALLGAQQLQ